MTGKRSKTPRPLRSSEAQARRRTRILQIVFAVFSILLILSMVLSLTQY